MQPQHHTPWRPVGQPGLEHGRQDHQRQHALLPPHHRARYNFRHRSLSAKVLRAILFTFLEFSTMDKIVGLTSLSCPSRVLFYNAAMMQAEQVIGFTYHNGWHCYHLRSFAVTISTKTRACPACPALTDQLTTPVRSSILAPVPAAKCICRRSGSQTCATKGIFKSNATSKLIDLYFLDFCAHGGGLSTLLYYISLLSRFGVLLGDNK